MLRRKLCSLKYLSYSKSVRIKGIVSFYKSSIFSFSNREMKLVLVLAWEGLFFLFFFFFLLIKGIIMENAMRDREILIPIAKIDI